MSYAFELVGVAVFASTGCLAAGRRQMDLFGVMIVGLVTALGGGTLRDLVLDAPVIWIQNQMYLIVAGAAVAVTFVWVRRFPRPTGLLLFLDAFGLAVFAVQGTQKALALGASGMIAVLMGAMTGVAGGVIRDMMCNEIPRVFTVRELYATPALAGAAVYAASAAMELPPQAGLAAGFATALLGRLAALRWKITLPAFVDAYEPGDDG